MVNDQLIRIHQLKQLLALENMSPKMNELDATTTTAAQTHDDPTQHDLDQDLNDHPTSEKHPPLPIATARTANETHTFHDSPEAKNGQSPPKSSTPVIDSGGGGKSSDSSPVQEGVKEKITLRKQNSTASTGSNQSSKRRSSWRNLLSPSYKSRSDEFHKLFCDKIPKAERLIADYACALHREILIQGRVYISVNYIAFYSNLFSWITKLVVRLRDISEIYKANTARIIPNAIQIIMTNGEKHVFASFVARDKSYVMMLRIWQNNLMNERMTDQDIRNLVHYSYGKDLGMSDNEELKINSPDPVTPANFLQEPATCSPSDVPCSPSKSSSSNIDLSENSKPLEPSSIDLDDEQLMIDRNNNSQSSQQQQQQPNKKDSEQEESGMPPILLRRSKTSPIKQLSEQQLFNSSSHTRYNSCDLNLRAHRANQNDVIAEVVCKLNELPASFKRSPTQTTNEVPFEGESYSPANSSAVVVDTPNSLNNWKSDFVRDHNDLRDSGSNGSPGGVVVPLNDDEAGTNEANGCPAKNRHSLGASSTETKVPNDDDDDDDELIGDEEDDSGDDDASATRRVDGEELIELVTRCECQEHQGQLIVDQEFDINVDTLFTLIFTNSKFMRTYMIRRGMRDTIITGWKRQSSNGGGDKSNSSTLSSDGRQASAGQQPHLVRLKQYRQLTYSMDINHMWAKQVHTEERQTICQVKSGVYALKSESINSGIPYGEAFNIQVSYCLTRNGDINKSRMLVHGLVNFNKDKLNWKLAMVKSMIEKQSIQGINDFIGDLTGCIKEYISETLERNRQREHNNDGEADQGTPSTVDGSRKDQKRHQRTPMASRKGSLSRSGGVGQSSGATRRHYNNSSGEPTTASDVHVAASTTARHSGSLARAKSKLKERKLRSMYRYYIHNTGDDVEGGQLRHLDGHLDRRGRHHRKHQEFDTDDHQDQNQDQNQSQDDDENSNGGFYSDDDSGSSLASFASEDIEDTGSMRMMMHQATDDQVSVATSLLQATDELVDRSFSDVDNHHRRRRRRLRRHRRQQQSGDAFKRLTSESARYTCGGRASASPINQRSASAIGANTTGGNWSPAMFRRHCLSLVSTRKLLAFMSVTLLMLLLAMIVSHVIILRRLDSLESKLRNMKCTSEQQQQQLMVGGGGDTAEQR